MGKQIKELTARLAVAGDDMLPMQGANDLNYYGTVAQLGGYIGNYTKGLIEAAVTCGSAADDENKAVTLTLGAVPSHLTVTFTNGNTYGDTTAAEPTNPKLVVTTSDGVEHTYNICDSRGHVAGKGFCNAGDDIDFIIIGNKARIQNSDIRQAEANYTIKADGYCVQWGDTPEAAITAHANTVEIYNVALWKKYTSVNSIEITLWTGSSSAEDMSKIQHARSTTTLSSFDIRIFCGALQQTRAPRYSWIATGYVN